MHSPDTRIPSRSNPDKSHYYMLRFRSVSRSGLMPVEVDGRLVNTTTILLDQPLENGGEKVIVRLKKRSKKTIKLTAPEGFILDLAEKDLEELY